MKISLLNRISFAILLTAFAPLTYWGKVAGAQFPTHFSILTGVPDGWGGRGDMLILMGVTVAIYVLLVLCCRYPRMINYPVKATEKEKLFPLGVVLAQRLNWMLMLLRLQLQCCAVSRQMLSFLHVRRLLRVLFLWLRLPLSVFLQKRL